MLFCLVFKEPGVKMDSDSIYDQHKMTALMFDRKTRYESKSSKSHFHHKDTDAHLMQQFHF